MAFDPHPAWLVELASCPSTNTWALTHRDRLVGGQVVWTHRQTAGRGRDGRTWLSPPGGLTASFIIGLRRRVESGLMGLAAGLAVAHAVEDARPGLRIGLKWPNDCLLLGRKLAGILCEGQTTATGFRLVVGIGLNLATDWSGHPVHPQFHPISLSAVSSEPLPPSLWFLTRLRRYLLEAAGLIGHGRSQVLLDQIATRDALLGQSIQVVLGSGMTVAGQAAGIDDHGRLRLVLAEGGLMPIASGHVLMSGFPESGGLPSSAITPVPHTGAIA